MLRPLFILLFSATLTANAQDIPRPKLVVGVVVDQMRWDYLYRYWDRYGSGGFKRLLKDGFACQQAFINYMPAFTGPGHATIWTGAPPAIHGIAGNEWYNNKTGRLWYCVEDTTERAVSGAIRTGRVSPRSLLTTTVGDELRLATANRSQVFAFSLKDRAAVLPGGHTSSGTYWYDDSTGRFVTSTYYAQALPDWLKRFNSRGLADLYLREGWPLLRDSTTYHHSTRDNSPYEGKLRGEEAPVFPHRTYKALDAKPPAYGLLRVLPGGNEIIFDLVESLMEAEGLGTRGTTDLLAINLAATDYAGHQYGPAALEMEDMYIRLDETLALFLRRLDKVVGKDNYLFFLTADHGSAHNAAFLQDRKIPAGLFSDTTFYTTLLRDAARIMPGFRKEYIRGLENYQVYLDEGRIAKLGADRATLKAALLTSLRAHDSIAYAVDLENIPTAVPEPLRTMMINGYHAARSGVIQIVPQPGWYAGYGPTGTTHGTWNPYDTHIPLIWYGWNIPRGETHAQVSMTDIAPTLSALLHIQMPNGCTGTPILPVLGEE